MLQQWDFRFAGNWFPYSSFFLRQALLAMADMQHTERRHDLPQERDRKLATGPHVRECNA